MKELVGFQETRRINLYRLCWWRRRRYVIENSVIGLVPWAAFEFSAFFLFFPEVKAGRLFWDRSFTLAFSFINSLTLLNAIDSNELQLPKIQLHQNFDVDCGRNRCFLSPSIHCEIRALSKFFRRAFCHFVLLPMQLTST